MKKLLLSIVLITIIVAAAAFLIRLTPVAPLQPAVSPSPVDPLSSIVWQNKSYRFTWFAVQNLDNLNLYPNTDADTSQDLRDSYQCQFLSSGGFYKPDHQPLGWLVSKSQELSAPISSRLLDGFMVIGDQAQIEFARPQGGVRAAVQSGPMLVFDAKPLNLIIANDELRRRIVAMITPDGQLIFLVVTGQDSELSGPLLSNLPELVLAIGQRVGLSVDRAINLDGGTASAFYTEKVYLKELNPVGNAWCYN